MLTIRASGGRLCDGLTRREVLHAGSLACLGLSLPELLTAQAQANAPRGKDKRAKSCIVLFLMGGPPQHSTWDPKPDTTDQIRGEFKPIATNVPGIQISELLPRLARQADRLCILRAMSTMDNAHSSSGYYMMTGQPHVPMNFENANPGAPNDWPVMGGVVQRLLRGGRELPAAVRLPHRIFNTDGSVWPGQDAGFLGRNADPWLLRCEPASPGMKLQDFSLPADVPSSRLDDRHTLLAKISESFNHAERGGLMQSHERKTQQACDLQREPACLRSERGRPRARYGRKFRAGCFRRLTGGRFVRVNCSAARTGPTTVLGLHTNESPR